MIRQRVRAAPEAGAEAFAASKARDNILEQTGRSPA
jgi:hypothetical protein